MVIPTFPHALGWRMCSMFRSTILSTATLHLLRCSIAPVNTYFGTVVIDRDGRLTLPVCARKVFNIKAGDELLLIGDIDRGLALMDTQFFVQAALHVEGGPSCGT